MELRAVWVLNLDAEYELGTRGGWTPSAELARLVAAARERAAASVPAGERVLEAGEVLPPELRGAIGRAWCMTPSARAALVAAGAVPEPTPDVEVLRRVHGREFAVGLGEPLPGERFAKTLEECEAVLVGSERTWLAKRAYSTAGRGQRRLGEGGLSEHDRKWLERGLAQGGVQLEPFVSIELETVAYGWVREGGGVEVGRLFAQEVTNGAWVRTREVAPGELSDAERQQLEAGAREAGTRLQAAGYFGPFGVDGFVWRDPGDERRVRAVGEVNPRYTMGWEQGRSAS